MSDPLIEGILNDDIDTDTAPKPGFMENVCSGVKEHVFPANDVEDIEGIEEKRESLAILCSLGTAKDYLGVQMDLGDVMRLTPKGVKKYYYRYKSVLGKQVAGGLVENVIKLASKVVSNVVSIDDPDALSDDLAKDEPVRRELNTAAGYLVLKGGRFVALASALFHVIKHVNFTMDKKILVERPEGSQRPEGAAEDS